MLCGIADVVFDGARQHDEGLLGGLMGMQARPMARGQDGNKPGRAPGPGDRRHVAEGVLGIVQQNAHDLAGKEDVQAVLANSGQIFGGGHFLDVIKVPDPAVELLF